jgi:hypothetical protein
MANVAELEQQLTVAKADAAEAARLAVIARKDAERAENGARALIYGLGGTDSAGLMLRLAAVDGRFGGLLGTQRQVSAAQLRAMEHRDGNLDIALDALECKAWAAVAHRIRVCAGEEL